MNCAIKLIVPILIVGLAALAQAKEPKIKSGLRGKIIGMSGNGALIIQTARGTSSSINQMTIHTDANTTVEINGVAGKRVLDLQAGERVIIQGDPTGIVSDIQAKSKHHGRRRGL